jgi:hypothetical protein
MRILLIALTALTLVGCGEKKETAAAKPSTAATPAAQAFPTEIDAPLLAGTAYATKAFSPPLTVTPSSGEWKVDLGDSEIEVSLRPRVDVPVEFSVLGFGHIEEVFDPEKGAVDASDAEPAPEDLAVWLADHPHLRATTPKSAEVMGLKGQMLEITYRSNPKQIPPYCDDMGGTCVPLWVVNGEVNVLQKGGKERIYVLEQGDQQLLVEEIIAPESAFDAGIEQLEATLRSARLAEGASG